MNLVDIIAKNARFHANQSAFVEVKPITGSRKEVSWLQFHEKTNKIAHALLNKGIRKGPWLTSKIFNIFYYNANFLIHFTFHAFLKGFSRLYKACKDAVKF